MRVSRFTGWTLAECFAYGWTWAESCGFLPGNAYEPMKYEDDPERIGEMFRGANACNSAGVALPFADRRQLPIERK